MRKHPDHEPGSIRPVEDHLCPIVARAPVFDDGDVIEAGQAFRLTHEVLGGLDQTGLDAPPAMMTQVQPTGLVIRHQRIGILRPEPPEIVAPGKHEKVAGESVPADVGHLPGPVRSKL
jgi:hypothetical protein